MEKDAIEDVFSDEEPNTEEAPQETEAQANAETEVEVKASADEPVAGEDVNAEDSKPPESVDSPEGDAPAEDGHNGAAFKKVRETAYEKGRAEAEAAHKSQYDQLQGQITLLTQQLSAPQQAQQQPTPKDDMPDPVLEPEQYGQWVQTRIDERLFVSRMQGALQQEMSTGKTEAELEQEATPFYNAMQRDVNLQAGLRSAYDPIAYIRKWNHQQRANQELASYGGDIDAYIAAKVSAAQTQAQAKPSEPVKIPQSIADTRPATPLRGDDGTPSAVNFVFGD